MLTIAEIMTTQLYTLGEGDTLAQVRELMAEHNIRHVPVVDSDGALRGIVSHRDVLAAGGGEKLLSAIMTRDVDTVDERANVREAALFLFRNKHGCLPVVTDGELKGIVTDSDFVAVAINLLEQIEQEEPEEEFEQY